MTEVNFCQNIKMLPDKINQLKSDKAKAENDLQQIQVNREHAYRAHSEAAGEVHKYQQLLEDAQAQEKFLKEQIEEFDASGTTSRVAIDGMQSDIHVSELLLQAMVETKDLHDEPNRQNLPWAKLTNKAEVMKKAAFVGVTDYASTDTRKMSGRTHVKIARACVVLGYQYSLASRTVGLMGDRAITVGKRSSEESRNQTCHIFGIPTPADTASVAATSAATSVATSDGAKKKSPKKKVAAAASLKPKEQPANKKSASKHKSKTAAERKLESEATQAILSALAASLKSSNRSSDDDDDDDDDDNDNSDHMNRSSGDDDFMDQA